MGVLHSFSIKKIFYDKMDFKVFYFRVRKYLLLIVLIVTTFQLFRDYVWTIRSVLLQEKLLQID